MVGVCTDLVPNPPQEGTAVRSSMDRSPSVDSATSLKRKEPSSENGITLPDKITEESNTDCIQLSDDDDIVVLDETAKAPVAKKARIEASPTPSAEPSEVNGEASESKSKSPEPAVEEAKETTSEEAVPEEKSEKDKSEAPEPSSSSEESKPSETTTEKKDDEEANKKSEENYAKLLDKVEKHVSSELKADKELGRKLMDVMLAAINQEVLSDPHRVRQLIIDKKLVLPNTISHPASQYVHLLIDHDAENPINRVITRLFGNDKPRESEQERVEKAKLRKDFISPAMTRVVAQIGQELVQEYTYGDIVYARNLPDMPKDIEGYKKVAEQLKPVWQSLKEKNAVYKCKTRSCRVCRFKTDSLLAFSKHQWTLHYDGRRYACTMCKEFNNNVARMRKHYMEEHAIVPSPAEEFHNRFDCPICEAEFKYKGELSQHLRDCKRSQLNHRRILCPQEDDKLAINRWLWPKPTIEPTVTKATPKPAPPKAAPSRPQALAASARGTPASSNTTPARQAAAPAPNPANLAQLLPILANLSTNPAALEKIKVEHPALYRQLQEHFAQLKNNPTALAQMQKLYAATTAKNKAAAPTPPSRQPAAPKPGPVAGPSRGPVSLLTPPFAPALPKVDMTCEICDIAIDRIDRYLDHLQKSHKKMQTKKLIDMNNGPPLACSRCKDKFWCYDGLERHLVMSHGLVTQEFLRKAQNKQDGGRCQICKKQYAFNMLQHLVQEHSKSLCSAEIRYSCDVCQFSCTNYQELETHLAQKHPKN
uniref:C2H2-type domain-containing protein n=1 Tax=Panagrellus redivivus TaxID=6233 RepID=A0A7E4W6Q3_PANRE